MATKHVNVERFNVISTRPFQDVVESVEAKIGHPDIIKFTQAIAEAETMEEMHEIVHSAVGKSDLMEFMRLDIGQILRKDKNKRAPQSVRLIVGNPLIMKEMVQFVPDAASYAPVTILIDERSDGVHLSYDCTASFLESYGSAAALGAKELDAKVETLLTEAAR